MFRHILNNTWTNSVSSGIGGGGGRGGGGFPSGNSTGNGTAPGGPGGGGGGGPPGGGGGPGVLGGLSGGTSLDQSLTGYASGAEVCIAFINAFSGEGADRTELRNDDQDEMITTVASVCNNTVVLYSSIYPRTKACILITPLGGCQHCWS